MRNHLSYTNCQTTKKNLLTSFKGGRLELADKENFEISILNKFLPESMSEKDIIKLDKEIIKETNAKNYQISVR